MRWYRLLLWIAIFAVGFPALANADPVSTAIVTWVASAAFAASTAGAIVIGALDLAISAGLSYVARADEATQAMGVTTVPTSASGSALPPSAPRPPAVGADTAFRRRRRGVIFSDPARQ